MSFRYRPMLPADAGGCAAILRANPYLRARYADPRAVLERAWLHLAGREAGTAVVFEDVTRKGNRLFGAGISFFATAAFARRLKARPLCWVGAELARWISSGRSPVLSDSQLREANTRGELRLIGVHAVTSVEDATRVEVHNFIFGCFIELHRGFFVKEVMSQADSPLGMQALLNSGGGLFDPAAGDFVAAPLPSEAITRLMGTPHLVGMTRAQAFAQPSLIGTALFNYEPPRCGFSRSQQRVLLAALQGGTDAEVADGLRISLSSVKKTWLGVYERAAPWVGEVSASKQGDVKEDTVRGKTKKNRVLAYMRAHPEELRPHARMLPRRKRSPPAGRGRSLAADLPAPQRS